MTRSAAQRSWWRRRCAWWAAARAEGRRRTSLVSEAWPRGGGQARSCGRHVALGRAALSLPEDPRLRPPAPLHPPPCSTRVTTSRSWWSASETTRRRRGALGHQNLGPVSPRVARRLCCPWLGARELHHDTMRSACSITPGTPGSGDAPCLTSSISTSPASAPAPAPAHSICPLPAPPLPRRVYSGSALSNSASRRNSSDGCRRESDGGGPASLNASPGPSPIFRPAASPSRTPSPLQLGDPTFLAPSPPAAPRGRAGSVARAVTAAPLPLPPLPPAAAGQQQMQQHDPRQQPGQQARPAVQPYHHPFRRSSV
jgi:hypothetical protein